jgi:hypothetical protein
MLPTPKQSVLFERLSDIFTPYAELRRKRIIATNRRFVHYTSAEAAMQIIRSKRLWLRSAACMRDFPEVQHGFDILNRFFSDSARYTALFDALSAVAPGLGDEGLLAFNRTWAEVQRHTYIACLSEHDDIEDWNGRLSMWRACGGAARVGLVMRLPLESGVAAPLKIIFSPVAYFTNDDVDRELATVTSNIRKNADFLRNVSRDTLIACVHIMMLAAIVSLKHPGFKEEQEWRVIYSPKRSPSDLVKAETTTLAGVPQTIHLLPFDDAASVDLEVLAFNNVLDRVIIGPTPFSEPMRQAFVAALLDAGILDAGLRVCASNIPIRT